MMAFRLWFAMLVLGAIAIPYIPKPSRGMIVIIDESFQVELIATSDDGFSAPDGIAWHDHRIYLADEGASAVCSLEPSAAVQSTIHTSHTSRIRQLAEPIAGIHSPEDLVIDFDGTIFFTDDDAGGVWQISTTGDVSQLAGRKQGLLSTEGLVLAPNNSNRNSNIKNLLVGDGLSHSIFEVTRQGEVSLLVGPEAGIVKPESLTFDPEGNLYIADNQQNVVFRLNNNDHCLERLVTPNQEPFHPESICFCGGALYITDDESGKLYRFTSQDGLKVVAVFAGRLKNVQGIAPGPDESLLVTVQDLKSRRGLILKISQGVAQTALRPN